MSHKTYNVYIMASRPKGGTLYVGVTSNLIKRVMQHKKLLEGGSDFVDRYMVNQLVYYEAYDNPSDAITREKRLKTWQRAWKIRLIEESNPEWKDLFHQLYI